MLTTLKQFSSAIWGMCRLRQGPEDLPRNHLLFGLVIVLSFVDVASNPSNQTITPEGVFEAVRSTDHAAVNLFNKFLRFILELLYVWCVLRLFNLQSRTYKTFFAVVATTLFIQMIGFLVIKPLSLMHDPQHGWDIFYLFIPFIALMLCWLFLVGSHIFRRSLDTTFPRGMLAFIGLVLLPQFVRIAPVL